MHVIPSSVHVHERGCTTSTMWKEESDSESPFSDHHGDSDNDDTVEIDSDCEVSSEISGGIYFLFNAVLNPFKPLLLHII